MWHSGAKRGYDVATERDRPPPAAKRQVITVFSARQYWSLLERLPFAEKHTIIHCLDPVDTSAMACCSSNLRSAVASSTPLVLHSLDGSRNVQRVRFRCGERPSPRYLYPLQASSTLTDLRLDLTTTRLKHEDDMPLDHFGQPLTLHPSCSNNYRYLFVAIADMHNLRVLQLTEPQFRNGWFHLLLARLSALRCLHLCRPKFVDFVKVRKNGGTPFKGAFVALPNLHSFRVDEAIHVHELLEPLLTEAPNLKRLELTLTSHHLVEQHLLQSLVLHKPNLQVFLRKANRVTDEIKLATTIHHLITQFPNHVHALHRW